MKPHLLSRVAAARATHKLVFGRRRPLRKRVKAQRPPKHVELAYTGFVLRWLRPLQAKVRALWPRLRAEVLRIEESLKADALSDVKESLDVLRLEFEGPATDNALQSAIRAIGQRTAEYQGSQLQEQIRTALGVELPLDDPRFAERLNDFVTENIALIKSVPAKYLDAVQSTVMSGATSGLRWEEIAAKLVEQEGVAESRAALIARDQVGKFYGSVQQARQQNLGITGYIWETAGDERVRDEHEALDGQTFLWSDAPDEGHPGQAINCRCTATPDFSGALEGLSDNNDE